MYRDDVISFVDDDNDDEGSLWAVPYEYMIVVFLSWCQCQELIIIMLV